MLDLAILGLLKERSMHGYELKKQLTLRLGLFWKVSFGSLYPTLKKLARHGWVARAASTDYASRRKQIYEITPAGEQRLLDLLEEGPSSTWEDDKFSLRLAFFRYLRPETRIRLLERRKQSLEERLSEGERSLAHAKDAPADRYTLSLMRHGMAVTQADITWLAELIAAERAATGQSSAGQDDGLIGDALDASDSAPDQVTHDRLEADGTPTTASGDSKGAQ